MKIVVVPGYTGSGPEHWQTWIETTFKDVSRVKQEDWDHVERNTWIEALERHLASIDDDVFLVGHSCGSVTLAQWAASRPVPDTVRGALLVAPADIDSDVLPEGTRAQRPLPSAPLRVQHTLVASRDDPYLSAERAQDLAAVWGSSEITWVEDGGHLSSVDGYGAWPGIVELIERRTGQRLRRVASS